MQGSFEASALHCVASVETLSIILHELTFVADT